MQGLQGLSSSPGPRHSGQSLNSLALLSRESHDQRTQLRTMWPRKEGFFCPGKASTLKTPGFLKKAPVEWV